MALNFPSNPTAGQVYGSYVYNGTSGVWDIISLSDGIPAGVIMAWGSTTAPANWLICDGSAVSRSTYASLFSAIGTTYGSGNGTTTFNLPDLRGRVPVGKNSEGTLSTLGNTGGVESVTLTEAQMPSHTHIQNAHTHTQDAHSHGGVIITGGLSVPNGSYYGVWGNYGLKNTDATTATNQSTTATNQNTGGGQAHTNLQPYQVVNYIIKYSAANTPGDSELATRVGSLETADATTNKAGLVPIIPTSISVNSGSASVASDGTINFSGGVTNLRINGCFSSSYKYYRLMFEVETTSSGMDLMLQLINLGSGYTYGRVGVISGPTVVQTFASGSSAAMLSRSNGGNGTSGWMDIVNPSQSATKRFLSQSVDSGFMLWLGSINGNAGSYSDFQIYSLQGGTMTSGSFKVYGYR